MFFDIVLIGLIFHHKHEIIPVALENREYKSEEGQRFCVDQIIKDVDADSIKLLVIPGGDPSRLVDIIFYPGCTSPREYLGNNSVSQ